MFQTADVAELTGLSRGKVREWSIRRDLIPPDVKPHGPGRHALYSWETVVVLRVLKEVHDRFAGELKAWAEGMVALRTELQDVPFPSLWGLVVHFRRSNTPVLVSAIDRELLAGMILPLDPHLRALASRLSVHEPEQRTLFPAVALT